MSAIIKPMLIQSAEDLRYLLFQLKSATVRALGSELLFTFPSLGSDSYVLCVVIPGVCQFKESGLIAKSNKLEMRRVYECREGNTTHADLVREFDDDITRFVKEFHVDKGTVKYSSVVDKASGTLMLKTALPEKGHFRVKMFSVKAEKKDETYAGWYLEAM